jgi:hypothetical protein
MNEQIKELAEQAGLVKFMFSEQAGYLTIETKTDLNQLEHFADLIRRDEAKACAKHYLGIMRDAVEQAVLKEREACAKFLESTDLSKAGEYTGFIANMLLEYAKAIRARGKK